MPALLRTTQIQEPSSASVNLTLDTSGNGTFAGTAVMSSPYTMRNKIINGAMQIAQRGTSVTPVSGSYSYAIDRFFVTLNSGSSGFTVSQLSQANTGLTGFYSALRFQRNSGQTSTTNQAVGQTIETANCQDLQGQSVILSFYARAGSNFSAASSQITARIATGTGVDEGTNGGFNNTWTGYAQTQSTITLSASWQRFTVTASIGSSVNEIQILFYWAGVGTAGANDYVDITGVQLERGTVATPFEYRNYQQELAMCQRYYQMSYEIGTVPGTNTTAGCIGVTMMNNGANNLGNNGSFIKLPINLRTTPTLTIYPQQGTITAGNFTVAKASTPAANYAALSAASSTGFSIYSTASGVGGTAGTASEALFQYTASAEL